MTWNSNIGKSSICIDKHWPLMLILGWRNTPERVLLKVKLLKKAASGKSNMTLRFKTANARQAKEICSLLLSYAEEVMKAVAAGRKKEKK